MHIADCSCCTDVDLATFAGVTAGGQIVDSGSPGVTDTMTLDIQFLDYCINSPGFTLSVVTDGDLLHEYSWDCSSAGPPDDIVGVDLSAGVLTLTVAFDQGCACNPLDMTLDIAGESGVRLNASRIDEFTEPTVDSHPKIAKYI